LEKVKRPGAKFDKMIIQTKNTETIAQARSMVSLLLDTRLPAGRTFHNLRHTQAVVQAVEMLCDQLGVVEEDREIVLVAAWFHDTGHIKRYEGHEKASAIFARQFLLGIGWSRGRIEKVLGCIRATKMPQQPHNLLEEILCDADLYHLAADDYLDHLGRLRREWELVLGKKETDRNWVMDNLEFLGGHRYFTEYGKEVLEWKMERNIELLLEQL
jgi:uncharacterized protein